MPPQSSGTSNAPKKSTTAPAELAPPQPPVHSLKNQIVSSSSSVPSPSNQHYDETDVITTTNLKRAISCDSICSDTSIALGDLEDFNITGYLCIGLEYDR